MSEREIRLLKYVMAKESCANFEAFRRESSKKAADTKLGLLNDTSKRRYYNTLERITSQQEYLKYEVEEIAIKELRNSLIPWEETWHKHKEENMLEHLLDPTNKLKGRMGDKCYEGTVSYSRRRSIPPVKFKFKIVTDINNITFVATILDNVDDASFITGIDSSILRRKSFKCIYICMDIVYNSEGIIDRNCALTLLLHTL